MVQLLRLLFFLSNISGSSAMRNNQMTTPRYWIKMIPTESVSHSEPCYSPNTKNPANLAGFDRLPL